ncbi:MAG: hypothetical protein K2W82_16455 [Candidatus Obscuribacterales bacterium]|nr:hypothetical protein [Candidatus Obscuribacterales bacterium]
MEFSLLALLGAGLVVLLLVVNATIILRARGARLRRQDTPAPRRRPADSYFLRYLSEDQRRAIEQAGIPFVQTALARWPEPVMLFEAGHLNAMLTALKAEVVYKLDVPNDQTMQELVLHYKPERAEQNLPFSVQAQGKFYSNKKSVLRYVREIILPVVQRNIVVHSMRESCTPIQDDNFHIFLFSSPSGQMVGTRGQTIWYVPHHQSGLAFQAGGRGVPLIDESTQQSVGELVDNCLYLYHDILDTERDRRKNIISLTWNNFWESKTNLKMALLVRILQQVKGELSAEKYLNEMLEELRTDGIISREASPYSVDCQGIRGRRQSVIQSLVSDILLPAVNTNVRVIDADGVALPPKRNDFFNIFFYSSPKGTPILNLPETIWGCRVRNENGRKAFVPSALGLPIIDDQGFIVGELLDGNLYLHHRLIHHGTREESILLMRLLIEVRNEVGNFKNLTFDDLNNRLTEQFTQECRRQAENIPTVAAQNKGNARQIQEEIQETLRSMARIQDELHRIENSPEGEAGREYDMLLAIPKIVDVQIDNNYINVQTRTIYCRHAGRKYDIGRFLIKIPLDYTKPLIWLNQDRHVHGMNAPHVNENGLACLGNMKEVFPLLIQQRNFAGAIEGAIAFVEAVNVNDAWGRRIYDWPVASGGD